MANSKLLTLKIIRLFFTAFLFLSLACSKKVGTGTLAPPDASQLLNAYIAALSTSDSNAVKPLWSQKSLARKGFWTIHNEFYHWGTFADWKRSVPGGKFEIQRTDRENDSFILQVRWLPRDSTIGQARDMKLYLIQEDGH